MRRIGLTPGLIKNEKFHELREVCDTNWSRLLAYMGYVPVLMSINYNNAILDELLLDGVIFTGGNDLSIIDNNEISKHRDEIETRFFNYYRQKAVPIMGVCRGMQLFAHILGDQVEKVDGHVATRHSHLKIFTGHGTKKITNSFSVNSFHNYGLKDVNDNWDILAISSNGVIEAISNKKEKILSYMWHPEREKPFCKQQIEFIKNFFEGK